MQGDFPNLLLCKWISQICCNARGFPKFAFMQGDFPNLLLCKGISQIYCYARGFPKFAVMQGDFQNLLLCKGISKICCYAHAGAFPRLLVSKEFSQICRQHARGFQNCWARSFSLICWHASGFPILRLGKMFLYCRLYKMAYMHYCKGFSRLLLCKSISQICYFTSTQDNFKYSK